MKCISCGETFNLAHFTSVDDLCPSCSAALDSDVFEEEINRIERILDYKQPFSVLTNKPPVVEIKNKSS